MTVQILTGDALAQLRTLDSDSVHCVVTSPPYWGLRCYGTDGQLGLEPTPEEHISALVEVFREVRRVLRKDGIFWMNYGDAYNNFRSQMGPGQALHGRDKLNGKPAPKEKARGWSGAKEKDLLMMPSRVALALQSDGWWLRSMMPWVKRNPMPESAQDRPGTAIEYVFMLTKSARYFYDTEAVRQADKGTDHPRNILHKPEPSGGVLPEHRGIRKAEGRNGSGRNFRNSDLFYASLEPPHGLIYADDPLALDVNPASFSDAHFATFPPKLIEPLIKAATSEKGCCAECGAPWVREVELTEEYKTKLGGPGFSKEGDFLRKGATAAHYSAFQGQRAKTLGWSPSCQCGANVHQCTILDPFGGAGTTGLVADRLGRDAILIELNPEYVAMARDRIDRDAATRGTGPQETMRGDDLPLFVDMP